MIKSRTESKLEIWSDKYINNIEKRFEEDKNKIILQIEPAGGQNNFIVEIIDRSYIDD